MKWLMIGLLVLAASVMVAALGLPDPGYVLLGYGNYSLETSLLVFVALLAIGYLVLRLIAGIWRVPGRLKRWGTERRQLRLENQFNQAVIELTDGRVERAERRLARLTRFPAVPLDVYLSAARAANQLEQDERRDASLKLALVRFPQAEVAVSLVEAELQLARNQLDQARTTLLQLQTSAPRNTQVLRLLMGLYVQEKDWQKLRELLPQLRQTQVLDTARWQALAVQTYRERVLELAAGRDIETLNSGWKQLPSDVQEDEGLLAMYLEQLVGLGATGQAEKLLRTHLKRNWNSRLVYLYGELETEDATEQQKIAERWLEQYPKDPVLLLTLGKISLRNQLWGKARNFLEASIARQATPEAYRLLGQLLEQLEEPEQAAECYRNGIELQAPAASTGAALPAPAEVLPDAPEKPESISRTA